MGPEHGTRRQSEEQQAERDERHQARQCSRQQLFSRRYGAIRRGIPGVLRREELQAKERRECRTTVRLHVIGAPVAIAAATTKPAPSRTSVCAPHVWHSITAARAPAAALRRAARRAQ